MIKLKLDHRKNKLHECFGITEKRRKIILEETNRIYNKRSGDHARDIEDILASKKMYEHEKLYLLFAWQKLRSEIEIVEQVSKFAEKLKSSKKKKGVGKNAKAEPA